jgi:hypothetical protein
MKEVFKIISKPGDVAEALFGVQMDGEMGPLGDFEAVPGIVFRASESTRAA